MDRWLNKILLGLSEDVLKEMPDNSISSIVTDPPYGLKFMGKKWDYDVPSVALWEEAYRVLKPGAHVLSFGGTRTYHRMVVNIEDAGFEIRDQILWIYGSGFPKSLNIGKAIAGIRGEEIKRGVLKFKGGTQLGVINDDNWKPKDVYDEQVDNEWSGWGTALKPAVEPICLARKPLEGTVANNVLKWGTGGMNIDECRVETRDDLNGGAYAKTGIIRYDGWGMQRAKAGEYRQPSGRFPANVIHDGSDEVLQHFPESNGQQGAVTGNEPSSSINNCYGQFNGRPATTPRNDNGSAARFFKTCNFRENELCEFANTAENHLSQLNQVEDSVLSLVAIEDNQEDRQLNNTIQPFMNEMRKQLREKSGKDTVKIQSLGQRCVAELKHMITEELNDNPVRYAETQKQINTMMIIQNLLSIDGFVGVVMSNTMLRNMVLGEKVLGLRINYCAKASSSERGDENSHPTVKPLDLIKYLVKLITPPDGIVLDMFGGSGTTALACLDLGFPYIVIEKEPDHVFIANERIKQATRQERLFL